MKWLVALETDNDPIPACRLMNVFRRKWVKIIGLSLAAQPAGFSFMAVVDSSEADVEHVYNFLRGLGGVRHVAYYRHQPSAEASFVFIDTDADPSSLARFLQSYPAGKLVFAGHGKYLYQLQAEDAARPASLAQPEVLTLSRVKASTPRPELVDALAEN